MPSAVPRHPPSDIEQFDADDMPSEMLADDEDVAEELLDEELGDEDDEEGIIGTSTSLELLHIYFSRSSISILISVVLARSNLSLVRTLSLFQYRSAPSCCT